MPGVIAIDGVGWAAGARDTFRRRLRSSVSVLSLLVIPALLAIDPAAAQTPEGSQPPSQPIRQINVDTPTRRAAQQQPARTPAPRRRIAPAQPAQAAPSPATQPAATGSAPPPKAASEMTFTSAEIAARPITRPAEILEGAPGLIITQHSGEGKANQYFLRGYNLDHGTDLAITLDGMPINMRTHGHGQGYSDLNFLIPELVGSVNVRKGPYYADEGDFSSAGALRINLLDTLEKKVAQVTYGSFGYQRYLGMGSTPLGAGNLLYAGEVAAYNGPWTHPDDMRKLSGVLRYSQGTADNGFSVTGMAYSNRWNSTDQVPLRAIASGEIGLYGALDPTDGGNVSRTSLSGNWAQTDDTGAWRANAYVVKSTLNLFNNFTFFLSDQANGDQFHQLDDRLLIGANAARTFKWMAGGLPMETTIGVQSRYDDIKVGLTNTAMRQFLTNTRTDLVKEGSIGIYAQNITYWTSWLRTIVGWRGDVYQASDTSIFSPANSGNPGAGISSPKFSMVLGPYERTELFVSAGYGFHSNDVRGVTITEDPRDPNTKLNAAPFLVRTRGAEIGIRTKIIPGLDSSISLFRLDQASELVFSGDAGDTEASRASRRVGVEFTGKYRPVPWLSFDIDFAVTRAHFLGFDQDQQDLHDSLAGYPQAQTGNAAGNFIPGAPKLIAALGITLGEKTGWFGALRYRYLGQRPLTEDNVFRSPATGLVNGQLGYRFENGWRVQLDVLNLFNSKTDQISYAYGSFLKSDNLFALCYPGAGASNVPAAVCQNGVMDRVLHPVEPLALRLTIAGAF
jgi:outer membrane receptor protein involved in Fe transport